MTTLIVNAICPEAMIADANAWAMIALDGATHGATFDPPGYQRVIASTPERFAFASFMVRADWPLQAMGPMHRPDWDIGHNRINQTGARRAAEALSVHDGAGGVPLAAPGTLLLILGIDARAALAAAGLDPIPPDF